MNANLDIYTVIPAYCVGDNTPQVMGPRMLRKFLGEQLDATLGPEDADLLTDPSQTLEDLFAEAGSERKGEDGETFLYFDVTVYGAVSSTLTVHAGDITGELGI